MEDLLDKITRLEREHDRIDPELIEKKRIKLGLRNPDGTGVVERIRQGRFVSVDGQDEQMAGAHRCVLGQVDGTADDVLCDVGQSRHRVACDREVTANQITEGVGDVAMDEVLAYLRERVVCRRPDLRRRHPLRTHAATSPAGGAPGRRRSGGGSPGRAADGPQRTLLPLSLPASERHHRDELGGKWMSASPADAEEEPW